MDPEREPLADLVEVDESEVPFCTNDDLVDGGQGRSHVSKLLIIRAVEFSEIRHPRRIRLEPITDFSGASVKGFVQRVVATGATLISDGWSGYQGLKEHAHRPKVVGKMAAHVLLPWVHRVFANLKRRAMGRPHGLRKAHLGDTWMSSCSAGTDGATCGWPSILCLACACACACRLPPATYRDFVAQRV